MPSYNSNKKATELETLTSATIADADVGIFGDADDLGRAKSMTWADYKTAIKTFLDTYYHIKGGTDVPIADGGTGASSKGSAIHNLLDGTVLSAVTVAPDDKVLIQDTSDSNVLKTVTSQSIADLFDELGEGNVEISGTPLNNQLAIWTAGDTIEGDAKLTFNGSTLALTGGMTVTGTVDGRDLSTDGSKLDGIQAGAQVNTVASVNTQTGAVVLDADDISDALTTKKFVTATDVTNLGNLSGTNSGDEPDATTTVKGIVELATTAEALTGTDQVRAVTPEGLKTVADTKVALAGDTMTGTLTLATGSTTIAPLKMIAGTNLTTPVAGVFEFDGSNLYFSVA
jgi:hypothetical protein